MKEIFKNVRNKLAEKYLDNNNLKYSKKFKPRIKARIRKNKQIINKNINDFFGFFKLLLSKYFSASLFLTFLKISFIF